MDLYILQDELIAPADAGGPAFASVDWTNPLSAGGGPPRPRPGIPRAVLFSGWFDGGESRADPRAGIFPQDFRTWTPAAWAGLDALCDSLHPQLEAAGQAVCFRPHARHVLGDPQACLSFLKRRAGQPFQVLLDATAFLTLGMLGRAEDHLTRAYQAMGEHVGVPGVVLTNVEEAGEGGLRPAPLTRGILDRELVVGLARRYAGARPWILQGEDVEGQRALL